MTRHEDPGAGILNTLKRKLGRKWIRPKPRTRQVWYVGKNTLLTETWFRRRIYLDSMDTSLTPTIARSGKWEPPVTDFLHSELKRGDLFMDIGPNCGFFLCSRRILLAAGRRDRD